MIKSTVNVRRNPRDHLLTKDISLQSLFCLFRTSDADYIADLLCNRKSELEELTKSNLTSTQLIDFLKMLVHVYNLQNSDKRSELLAITHSEEFVNHIKKFLQSNRNNDCLKEVIDLIMYFVDVNINELPASDVCYNRFYSLLKVLLDDLPADKFNDALIWAHELCLLMQKKIIHRGKTKNTWKNLDIYPSAVDLFEKKDLMPNKINGAYRNTDEYLDTMFKLLKEDYDGTLREGVLQMKAELRGNKPTEKDVFVYKNVNIERIETDGNPAHGVLHRIAFSLSSNENEFDKTDKPFKYGSLLLLSRYSQFTTFLLATVVDDEGFQNTENDTYKVLKVSFVGELLKIKPYWRYTMLETKTMYNPYYEVLNAIKSKSIDKFPMEKYVIHSNATPNYPRYISTDTEYRMDGKLVKLFSHVSWPKNILNLDFSQIEALQAAFTHEMVLIQGPPGSGKTHLARIIIDILIANKHLLSTPILLLSPDNYSVDNILEALAKKRREVIRLGNRTKSEVLKKHLLYKKVKPCGRDMKNKIERIKESLLQKINQNDENIENSVQYLKREQKSFRDACDENFANQILSGNFDVIGGTTAGCARLHNLLEKIKPEVVIVDNANEVLEAHVIASISEGCKHLILIGDHKQLKPNISNRNLENYDLDVSLFERMMRCGVKCSILKEQYRMRPEIASLLSPSVYSTLRNHPIVHKLPKIRGMQQNLFFIDHEVAENKKKDDEHSYSNKHEGDVLLGLANYLLLQGYSSKELTILVPYAEQHKYMIGTAKSYPLLKNLEIFTIDTYAGHENTIILLSLVRSQSTGIGFLTNNNKVVVALSRAKAGLYMIGNMKTLTAHSDLWVSLNADLKKKQAIGRRILMECETHKTRTEVSRKEDFGSFSKRGGCTLQCDLPLACGHPCQLQCHPLMKEHDIYLCSRCGPRREGVSTVLSCGHSLNIEDYGGIEQQAAYVCKEPCSRYCKEKLHRCKKKCHEECGPCQEDVEVLLPCGHSSKKKCFVDKETHIASYVCKESCLRFRELDLRKSNTKYNETNGNGNENIDVRLACGHRTKMKGYNSPEKLASFICHEPCLRYCKQYLHRCNKKCYEKCSEKCNGDVNINLRCGHMYKMKCYAITEKPASVCNQPCSRLCKNNLHQCKKKCNEKCGNCYEDVHLILPCGHLSKMKCFAKNQEHICKEPCSRFCKRNLHNCKKKCFEECGSCDEEIVVILPCGHSSKRKCSADEGETEACTKPTVVSYFFCLRREVPCWRANSRFYWKV